ncbi:MAG: nitroreductase family protein [Chloroflexi bacterium]|nr:nitroreductase family protein [Chloroflexota bacterium]MCY3583038.1 nitroreductase family protein [Chloroflexota bacterium]MCY3714961.1 nitroreductase family protein [Chloroflexota bacterium]MDE2650889.1 nitroreductase family protein [Chloroflexota bacterium]MXX50396.1 nitroreductase family protein [Chloroflexota bacterium]
MNEALRNIKTRRVVREMSDQAVEREQIEAILEAARWAPSGGNLRPNRYVVIEDAETRRLLRLVAPGMFQRAPVLILICTNWQVVAQHHLPAHDRALLIDIGTAAQTMLLAAHALGLASGPVTSYSKEAVRIILNLPAHYSPEMFICIGHKAETARPGMRAWQPITWRDLTHWERFPERE